MVPAISVTSVAAAYWRHYYYYYYYMIFQHSEQHEWMINDESMQVYGKVLKAYRQELPAAYKREKLREEEKEKQVLQGQRKCQVHGKSGLKLVVK